MKKLLNEWRKYLAEQGPGYAGKEIRRKEMPPGAAAKYAKAREAKRAAAAKRAAEQSKEEEDALYAKDEKDKARSVVKCLNPCLEFNKSLLRPRHKFIAETMCTHMCRGGTYSKYVGKTKYYQKTLANPNAYFLLSCINSGASALKCMNLAMRHPGVKDLKCRLLDDGACKTDPSKAAKLAKELGANIIYTEPASKLGICVSAYDPGSGYDIVGQQEDAHLTRGKCYNAGARWVATQKEADEFIDQIEANKN